MKAYSVGGGLSNDSCRRDFKRPQRPSATKQTGCSLQKSETTLCCRLMSVRLTPLETPGTEYNCLEDLTQNSVSLLLRGKIYWTLQEKKDGG